MRTFNYFPGRGSRSRSPDFAVDACRGGPALRCARRTASAAVDLEAVIGDAPNAPCVCVRPARRQNESFFRAKNLKSRRSMIEKQPRAPKEARAAPNHARITGALALIFSYMACTHVFDGERDRKCRALFYGGDTRHVLARSKKLLEQFFRYCLPDR